ncbi:MAG: hypothetical protein IT376_23510 [Polyangiaceae bacterium]|nr:hypothetical protein [Polyangiaceae bacterium]
MPRPVRLPPSLAVSVLLHGLVVGGAWSAAGALPSPAGPRAAASEAPDVWSGSTFDVDVLAAARESAAAALPAPEPALPSEEPRAAPPSPEPPPGPAEPPPERRAADGPRLVTGLTPLPTPPDPLVALLPPAEHTPTLPPVAPPRTTAPRQRRAERLDERRTRAARQDVTAARRDAERAERARRAREGARSRRTAAAASATSAAARPPGSASSGGASAAGADVAGGPVRGLAKAFVRALPEAANPDQVWRSLPLGESKEVRFTVSVDSTGKLTAVTADDGPPAHVMRMLERAVLLLRGGRFALDGAQVREGSASFRLRFRVERRAPVEDFGEPHHVQDLGHSPPERGKPGRAWFTLRSGLHVELTIALEGT